METLKFKTDIHCDSCIQKITPYLDKEESISDWNVDMESSDKVLSITGSSVDSAQIQKLMKQAGYEAIPYTDTPKHTVAQTSNRQTYFPLILIFLYLLGGVILAQFQTQSWNI